MCIIGCFKKIKQTIQRRHQLGLQWVTNAIEREESLSTLIVWPRQPGQHATADAMNFS